MSRQLLLPEIPDCLLTRSLFPTRTSVEMVEEEAIAALPIKDKNTLLKYLRMLENTVLDGKPIPLD